MVFTDAEIDYLDSQRLGRLATLTPEGNLQNSPVGFQVDEASGVINIFGRALGTSRASRQPSNPRGDREIPRRTQLLSHTPIFTLAPFSLGCDHARAYSNSRRFGLFGSGGPLDI